MIKTITILSSYLIGFFIFLEISLRLLPITIYLVEMNKYALSIKKQAENPEIGHIHRPNARSVLMNVSVKINSDGLRDREYPKKKTKQTKRYIFLGDSLTFAWGVEKEDSFEEILESKLNSNSATEVINFGTGNYNTSQQLNLFLEKGLKYEPDELVVFYFINDAEETPRRSAYWFVGYSNAATVIRLAYKNISNLLFKHNSYQSYYKKLYTDDAPGWGKTKEAFRKLKSITTDNQIKLKVVILPELHNLKEYPFKNEHKKLTEFLQKNEIPVLDITENLGFVENSSSLWVSKDDAHPNAKAHQLIAEYSFNFINRP